MYKETRENPRQKKAVLFAAGAVCLVLASRLYEPEDYLYEYEDFIEYIQQREAGK